MLLCVQSIWTKAADCVPVWCQARGAVPLSADGQADRTKTFLTGPQALEGNQNATPCRPSEVWTDRGFCLTTAFLFCNGRLLALYSSRAAPGNGREAPRSCSAHSGGAEYPRGELGVYSADQQVTSAHREKKWCSVACRSRDSVAFSNLRSWAGRMVRRGQGGRAATAARAFRARGCTRRAQLRLLAATLR